MNTDEHTPLCRTESCLEPTHWITLAINTRIAIGLNFKQAAASVVSH
jgi:hypothetical protein